VSNFTSQKIREYQMKKNLLLAVSILISTLLNGCIIFHKVSYEIDLSKKSAELIITDIRSDAKDVEEFSEDRKNLFDQMQKSPEFLTSMKAEGKNIVHRELFLNGDNLNGKVIYKFEDVSKVEGIIFEDGFYFLTLPLEDSILSTNGEVIFSENHKRILWDKTVKVLKFEMMGSGFDDGEYRKLAPYFNPEK